VLSPNDRLGDVAVVREGFAAGRLLSKSGSSIGAYHLALENRLHLT